MTTFRRIDMFGQTFPNMNIAQSDRMTCTDTGSGLNHAPWQTVELLTAKGRIKPLLAPPCLQWTRWSIFFWSMLDNDARSWKQDSRVSDAAAATNPVDYNYWPAACCSAGSRSINLQCTRRALFRLLFGPPCVTVISWTCIRRSMQSHTDDTERHTKQFQSWHRSKAILISAHVEFI